MRTLALTLAALLGGCMAVRYQTGRPVAATRTVEVEYYLWGLVGAPTIDVPDHCPQGLARLESEMVPLDVVIATVTLGFWSPRTVTLYCAAETSP